MLFKISVQLLKVFLYLLFLVIVLFLFDYTVGLLVNDSVAYSCNDEIVHHRYCPGATRTYRMHIMDGGKVIESYWNQDGVRVPNKADRSSHTVFSDFDHVIIGDSFGAQRQVNYNETVSANLRSMGYNAIQIGAGSWNFVNYHNFIVNNNFRKGTTLHILFMANDFYSYYGMSIASYYNVLNTKNDLNHAKWIGHKETFDTAARRYLSNNSFLYQNFLIKKPVSASVNKNLSRIVIENINNNCEQYSAFSKEASGLLKSLVLHAYDASCFDEYLNENIKVAGFLIDNLKKYAYKNDLIIKYYFIPNGTYSRKEVFGFKQAYGLSKESAVTSLGISSALKDILNIEIINFETPFKKYSDKNSENLYYPYDGHFNPVGSKVASMVIAKEIDGNNFTFLD